MTVSDSGTFIVAVKTSVLSGRFKRINRYQLHSCCVVLSQRFFFCFYN